MHLIFPVSWSSFWGPLHLSALSVSEDFCVHWGNTLIVGEGILTYNIAHAGGQMMLKELCKSKCFTSNLAIYLTLSPYVEKFRLMNSLVGRQMGHALLLILG